MTRRDTPERRDLWGSLLMAKPYVVRKDGHRRVAHDLPIRVEPPGALPFLWGGPHREGGSVSCQHAAGRPTTLESR